MEHKFLIMQSKFKYLNNLNVWNNIWLCLYFLAMVQPNNYQGV